MLLSTRGKVTVCPRTIPVPIDSCLALTANSDLSEQTHPRNGHTSQPNLVLAATLPRAARSALCRSRYSTIQSRDGCAGPVSCAAKQVAAFKSAFIINTHPTFQRRDSKAGLRTVHTQGRAQALAFQRTDDLIGILARNKHNTATIQQRWQWSISQNTTITVQQCIASSHLEGASAQRHPFSAFSCASPFSESPTPPVRAYPSPPQYPPRSLSPPPANEPRRRVATPWAP